MSLKIQTPPPHGGKLVDLVIRDTDKAVNMAAGAVGFDIRPTRSAIDGSPIRNVYREVMSIAYGFFSPLDGFMTRNEVESVLKERRLLGGWLFPFPIIFDVPEDELRKLERQGG
jgi:sulfate adenylyltransferase (EC 2.7.7.4)